MVVVILVCLLLVGAGLAAIVRWGGLGFQPPPAPVDEPGGGAVPPPAGWVARAYVWYLALAVASGIGAGVLVAGAGGRLVMRLLAATAGEAAQGRITEADAVVGRITVGGTVNFVIFTALFFGPLSAVVYLLIRRWLPPGRLGGLAYGALLLVVAATRLDPLRAHNPDFAIVGPGWVALVAFGALVLAQGMLVAALAARLSRWLPLLAANRRAVLAHLLLVAVVPVVFLAAIGAVVGAVAVLLTRVPAVVAGWRAVARRPIAGWALLGVVVLIALPGFVSSLVDIARAS